ncbi:hypothetical protein [Agrobacterium pusense]|uniref:hypothetical protein n=1 Tax=Agrobacterium pusense TaxID=648995 RepID=UPI00088412DA|nr:hypothetical protein BTE56_11550 [Agrobacterium pusense]SDE35249.1 hypothetical protein SAMN05421750_101341 [Agrobacterium pusense]
MFIRGRELFEISRRNDALPAAAPTTPDPRTLARFFISEEWSSELSSGVIRLGEHASFMHGLPPGECGLLSLVRCYDRADHARVLELFEQASSAPSRFCFSTGISMLPTLRQPVICMGESFNFEDGQPGRITGLFLFPRFEDMRFAA